jgi:hypothetical protein
MQENLGNGMSYKAKDVLVFVKDRERKVRIESRYKATALETLLYVIHT